MVIRQTRIDNMPGTYPQGIEAPFSFLSLVTSLTHRQRPRPYELQLHSVETAARALPRLSTGRPPLPRPSHGYCCCGQQLRLGFPFVAQLRRYRTQRSQERPTMLYVDQAAGFDERVAIPVEVVESVAAAVAEIAKMRQGGKLLEIGAGTGLLSLPLLRQPIRYIGFDLS